jgi:hypothetical protein
LLLNYTNTYQTVAPTNVVNQGAYFTATYQLPSNLPSAPSAGLNYFQLGVVANTDQSGTFVIDNVIAQAPVNHQTLFTTQSDWASWSSNSTGISVSAGAAGDSDGNPADGLGDVGAGNRDLSAGLTINVAEGQTFGQAVSPDEHDNTAFLQALAGASQVEMDFRYPPSSGSYFQPLLLLNFDNNYDQIAPSSIVKSGAYYTAFYSLPGDIPSNPSALTYFQMGVIANTDDTGSFTIDNIQAVAAVPEPASIFVVGLWAARLMGVRPRNRSL